MKKSTKKYIDKKFSELQARILHELSVLSDSDIPQGVEGRGRLDSEGPGYPFGVTVQGPPAPVNGSKVAADVTSVAGSNGHVHVIAAYGVDSKDKRFSHFQCACGESVKLRGEDVDLFGRGLARNLPPGWKMPQPNADIKCL